MSSSKIKAIYRIQNAKFWRDFCQERESLKKIHIKAGVNPNIREEWLWHGTKGAHPKIIYEGMEECFDMQYASTGMWGRGLYFAVNSNYSHGYGHPSPN